MSSIGHNPTVISLPGILQLTAAWLNGKHRACVRQLIMSFMNILVFLWRLISKESSTSL